MNESHIQSTVLDNSYRIVANYVKEIAHNPSEYNKELIEILDKVIGEDFDNFLMDIPKQIFRARVVKHPIREDERFEELEYSGYNDDNSREAPLTKSEAGRNSIKGQAYFYGASDKETACAEIKPKLDELISVAEFEMSPSLRIIDFCRDRVINNAEKSINVPLVITEVMAMFCLPVERQDDYLASQILAEHIRKTGVDGISYRSAYTNGTNYTIFNCNKNNLKFMKSWMVVNRNIEYTFMDIENKNVFKTANIYKSEYSEEIREYLARKPGMQNSAFVRRKF